MALGAVAVWLGKEAGNGSGFLIPACFCFSAVLAFLGWEARGSLRRGRIGLASSASSDARFPDPAEAGGAALLSHEMKNYLCTLKGNAHLLRQRVPSDGQAIIDRIDRVVEKLESFTRQLGAGEAATSLGALMPLSSAQMAQACVRTHFHKRIEDFRFSEDPAAPGLLCDPGRLDQVFLNLYSNALEAGASRVDTAIRREGGRLVLRIEDDGRGCAKEDLDRIFEPFFTTKSGPARRGLGMFIVQSIVENHGGSVHVATKNDSAAGTSGLIFTLEFPQPWRGAVSARPAPLIAAPDSTAREWMLALPVALR
jgi:signal transduction histidine kinase